MKLIPWDVNGLRAALRRNFREFLDAAQPGVLCHQETRVGPADVEQLRLASHTTCWNVAERPGYSGTALFTRRRPRPDPFPGEQRGAPDRAPGPTRNSTPEGLRLRFAAHD